MGEVTGPFPFCCINVVPLVNHFPSLQGEMHATGITATDHSNYADKYVAQKWAHPL